MRSKFPLVRTLVATGLLLAGSNVVLFSQPPRGGGPPGGQPNEDGPFIRSTIPNGGNGIIDILPNAKGLAPMKCRKCNASSPLKC